MDADGKEPNVEMAMEFDKNRFWKLLVEALKNTGNKEKQNVMETRVPFLRHGSADILTGNSMSLVGVGFVRIHPINEVFYVTGIRGIPVT